MDLKREGGPGGHTWILTALRRRGCDRVESVDVCQAHTRICEREIREKWGRRFLQACCGRKRPESNRVAFGRQRKTGQAAGAAAKMAIESVKADLPKIFFCSLRVL